VCQLTPVMRFLGTGLGRTWRWALMAMRLSVTVLEMVACMVGEES